MTDVIPAPSAALAERAQTRLVEPARRAGIDLPILGASPEPDGEILWQAPTSRWWLFRDHADDPTAAEHGGVVVPEDVRERLVTLLRAGLAPDLVLVGHEMPDAWQPGQTIPSLVPPPVNESSPVITASKARSLRGPSADQVATAAGVALQIGAAVAKGALVVGVAVGAVMAEVAAEMAQLDPVVIVGVRDPSSARALWAEAARWSW